MATTNNVLFRAYQRIIHSLAFYPTLIAVGFFLLCLLTMAIEYQSWMMAIKRHVDLGLVRNADNARLILGTLVAGILSLMVFSFSMVMVVLNNAAASLSPRVIPGLISSKGHQKTLGVYLGTILYALLLITTIEQGNSSRVPSLGVLVTLALGITCLGLFVHFIRSISQSIQVEHILNTLYSTSLAKLDRCAASLATCEPPPNWPDDKGWITIHAQRSGYFKALNASEANKLLSQHQLRMSVLAHRGFFVVQGHPLFKLECPVDETITQELLDCFDFFIEEYVSAHYFFGCRQMSEIAVKALSPGINDPGTAIKTIDLLSVLLGRRLGLPDRDFAALPDAPPRLYYHELTLDQLLLQLLGPIRAYGASDTSVLVSLLQAYKNMLYLTHDKAQQNELLRHARSVRDTADRNLFERRDREEINQFIARINHACAAKSATMPPLEIEENAP
ncbi:Uncharacterized membrane protein [Pseudomonas cuatrocienegasensis]|uniref:Uncharacterized membrane protein n=1 Tax=Pseudomonas cuatrocienegasensis TaxID=543360 RepID=A0ABY1B1N0_9PSED|nr:MULTISPECIES: DUF2254 family protein [Pseudomonas]OEC36473.1 hypothetical protein A7D25_04795 [Pseudomonas sp. 21C1]SEP70467.1 Uncharacterized membrane protein [Pseudomonas cuatrocienegasensis]